MLRSVFNYFRWGYTRQKAVNCLDEFLASMVKWESTEGPPGIDNSIVVRNYAKSLGSIYPDLTVRYGVRVAAALPDPTSEEARDCMYMVLDNADRGSRFDVRGVRDALLTAAPFMERFPLLQDRYEGTMYRLQKANPDFWSGPISEPAAIALNLKAALTR